MVKGGSLRELVWLGKDGGTRDAQGTLKKTGKTQNLLCICYFLSLNLNRCLLNPPSLVLPSPHQRTFNQHPTFSHLCICSSYTLLSVSFYLEVCNETKPCHLQFLLFCSTFPHPGVNSPTKQTSVEMEVLFLPNI